VGGAWTMRIVATALAAAVGLAVGGCGGAGGRTQAPGARSTIANIGSDTMLNLAAAWAEAYDRVDPAVSVEVSGGGSGQGAAALINGSCDIANCSRKLEEKEIAEIRSRRNLEAKEFIVGFDALSIFVHRSNPLREISVEDLGEMYREGGALTRWSQLGVTIPGAKGDSIILVNRQNSSGTYHYFKEAVVGKKSEFKLSALHMNGSKDAVDLIANTPNAIGYSGMGYATPDVRQVRVSKKKGAVAVAPSVASALDGTYPVARPMFMYTAGEPEGALRRFIDWVMSPPGQEIVELTGYVPRVAQ
jgi:phosphate transport system substrate-binding protein